MTTNIYSINKKESKEIKKILLQSKVFDCNGNKINKDMIKIKYMTQQEIEDIIDDNISYWDYKIKE